MLQWLGLIGTLMCTLLTSGELSPFSESSGEGELTNVTELIWWNFTIDCDPSRNDCDSLSLDQIAEQVSLVHIAEQAAETAHVFIEINISQLQLTGRVVFEHHESLTITGENTVISCTERNSGLVLIDINRVTLSNVTLTNCGAHDVNSPYYNAVCFLHCGDIIITNVSMKKNKATALSILDHQGGTVSISYCNFTENSITAVEDEEKMRGGGGIYICLLYTSPSPRDATLSRMPSSA